MASIINADTTNGVVITPDTSGEIALQSAGVTQAKITSSGLQNASGVAITAQSGRNLIINGDMRIAQRGTSFTSNLENAYTLDRWKIHDRSCTSRSVTQESFSTGSVSTFGKEVSNYLRATFSNDSGATPPFVMQAIEDVKSVAGETVTISFWAKANSAQDIELYYSQQFGGGGSSEVTATIDTFTLTTSWVKYTTTVEIPSISGKTVGTSSNLRIDWRMPANTAITYDMTLVQLETGTVATEFEHLQYGQQLALCQRYYYRGGNGGNGIFNTAITARYCVNFPTTMRAYPSITAIAAPKALNPLVAESQTGSQTTSFAITGYGESANYAVAQIQFGGFSSGADGRPTTLLNTCLQFNAEL